MDHRDAFSGCHPLVNFIYFALVFVFAMCVLHPVSLLISLGAALAYAGMLNGRKTLRLTLRLLLPVMVLTAVVNPAFNHEGATILTYLPTGNPLTLESLVYGLASAVMLAGVMTWCTCFSAVMTSDKFVYLFGRVIPALSLVLSMTLRLIPRFKRQYQVVSEARRCLDGQTEGTLFQKMKRVISVLSIMVTWSLENAIETADSMKSRGYGLPGRTAFSIYRMDQRDKKLLLWCAFCGGCLAAGWAAGELKWQYFPVIRAEAATPAFIGLQLIWLALCLTPLILNGKEELTWKHMRSAM